MSDIPATQDQQVLITRIFDAPRELVFRAWTDPDQVALWFGPEHFDAPRESIDIDLRVGGRWTLMMVERETGREAPAEYEIVELDPPRLLVMRAEPMPEFGIHQATFTRVELHDHGGKTRMTLSDGPYTEAIGAETAWNASFTKLERALAPS
jgi:uncharacterized protein YndB with AHSA1/START domain